MLFTRYYPLVSLVFLILTSCSSNNTVKIEYEKHPQIKFAVSDINVDWYEIQNFARLRTFDWNLQLNHAKTDIEIAKEALTYEAEAAINKFVFISRE